jgi:RNA polymerase sigma factor (sigma-70 family)
MATTALGTALHKLRRCLARQEDADCTDGALLERFISRRDEAAFEALLVRHGPMVLGVCRRVLRNEADAEDAFQATFLVLVRKAASVRPRGLVGNWLYGVAHRTALKARAMRTTRFARERETAAQLRANGSEDMWDRLSPLLDQGLKALPDKYRAAIVLCDLQGKSIKEAARQCGCPQATIGTRLARGRKLLSRWLARRGLALSAGVIASATARHAAALPVPPSLMRCALQAALAIMANPAGATGVISARVAAVTEGVLKTMSLTRLTIATAALVVALALAMVGFGMAWFRDPPRAAAQGRDPQDAPQTLAGKATAQRLKQKPAPAALGNLQTPAGNAKPVAVAEDAQVRSLAWSANGKLLVTVGIVYEIVEFTDADGKPTDKGAIWPNSTIKLWDATTGQLKRSLAEEKHTYIAAIALSPDGKTAAVSTSKHHEDPLKFITEVRVLDAQTWELKHKVDVAGFASVLAFSPDGARLALGGRSRLAENGSFVKLWDVAQGKMIGGTAERQERQLPLGTGGRVTCLAFSRDGKLLASGDENGEVRTYDGETGKATGVLGGHHAWVSGVGFGPDGKTLVSGSGDKTVKLWDVKAGKLVRTLAGNQGAVVALAFSPDGALFATAGGLGKDSKSVEILLWDAKTGELRKTFADQTLPVNALAFSPDGTTLAIGAGPGYTLGPDTPTGRLKTPGAFRLWKLK